MVYGKAQWEARILALICIFATRCSMLWNMPGHYLKLLFFMDKVGTIKKIFPSPGHLSIAWDFECKHCFSDSITNKYFVLKSLSQLIKKERIMVFHVFWSKSLIYVEIPWASKGWIQLLLSHGFGSEEQPKTKGVIGTVFISIGMKSHSIKWVLAICHELSVLHALIAHHCYFNSILFFSPQQFFYYSR